ncbi:MAG: TIGR02281 family clan AA aspartic protease [Rhodospirillales bacterium]|nr:TIGR02281 family clan AA aspartic protease [Alphaproteobacteria bacterium]MBL6948198.1 TIGR02281 family clan AA aspartic protease [Rhodospirillales bacterium]
MQHTRLFWLVLIAAVALGVAVFVFLIDRFPDAAEGEGRISLVHGVLLLTVLSASAVLNRRRFRFGPFVTGLLAWAVLGGVLFVGYSYRYELGQFGNRLMGELNPSGAISVPGGSVTIRADQSGHFVVEADVTEQGSAVPIRFLVDTGASDVVLSPSDARRLGFDVDGLAFTRRYRTANGTVFGAPVRIERITISGLSLDGVRGSVNGAPMGRSLLGMSFLGRLSGYDVSRETMTLRP